MTLLAPGTRHLLATVLSPPDGFRLDRAIATTYSLDLQTLLPIPVTMAITDAADPDVLTRSPVALLNGIREVADRFAVFAQEGGIKAGHQVPQLCALLEDSVYAVRAPRGGSFHAKVWCLRFRPKPSSAATEGDRLRLAVLTRNLTDDRAWDLDLAVDGVPGNTPRAANAEIARFLRGLPGLTVDGDAAPAWIAEVAGQVATATWETPPGYRDLRFYATGLDASSAAGPLSELPRGDRVVVLSPFVTNAALKRAAGRAPHEAHLVSRAEELAEIDNETQNRFASIRVLDEAAQSHDGEIPDTAAPQERLSPLHAKAYAVDNGKTVHLLLGSANATHAALVANTNIEVLAHLKGDAGRVGSAASILDREHGFGRLLADFQPVLAEPAETNADRERRQRLERVRDAIIAARPRLVCETSRDGSAYRPRIVCAEPPDLEGLHATAWLVTSRQDHARDLAPLAAGAAVSLPAASAANLTRFLAFELADPQARADAPTLSFCLCVRAEGLPDDRTAAIFRAILTDRRRFLEYVRLLLGDIGAEALMAAEQESERTGAWHLVDTQDAEAPLLEQLLRAQAQDPDRLTAIREVVAHIAEVQNSHDGEAVVPPSFWRIWQAFEEMSQDDAGRV